MARRLPPHGTLARYKHRTKPCRCNRCKAENTKSQRLYRWRTGRTKKTLVSIKGGSK